MSYTGTDNLEIMQEAVNYNQYLVKCILRFAKPSDYILDFGAGIGLFAKSIVTHGYKVICVEADEQQAHRIRQSGLVVNKDLSKFDNESLDYVYSLNVLEHIEDDVSLLHEMYQKMKPGAKLFIYVPAFQMLYTSMDTKVGHFRRYQRKDLVTRVQSAGFKVQQSQYADSIGFFATLFYKWFGSEAGDINPRALKMYDSFIFPLSYMLDKVTNRFFGKNVMVIARK